MSKSGKSGFTLTEIMIAVSIMAFALIPIMGIIWSGVRRTDISVTYENASQIAASIMEFILSDAVKFEYLDFSNPTVADVPLSMQYGSSPRESTGFHKAVNPFGEIDRNKWLGTYCEAPDWSTDTVCANEFSRQRFFKVGREQYHVDLYVGAYYSRNASPSYPTQLTYSYLKPPKVDFEQISTNPQRFYDTLVLNDSNSRFSSIDFSPYSSSTWNTSRDNIIFPPREDHEVSDRMPWVPGSAAVAGEPSLAYSPLGPYTDYANFAKIQLFIRWGLEWMPNGTKRDTSGVGNSRGGAKVLELVSFKGRLDSE
jgi:prepilin-type N-terminal cleavage/methylation domain-containing protein